MLIRRGAFRWWEDYTLLTDTAEKRAERERRFRDEASRIFQRGVFALGEEEAKKIWKEVTKKRGGKQKGTIHKRDEAAVLMNLHDEAVAAQESKLKPITIATRKFIKITGSKESEPTIRRRLERHLERRAETEKKQAEIMKLYPPTLLSEF